MIRLATNQTALIDELRSVKQLIEQTNFFMTLTYGEDWQQIRELEQVSYSYNRHKLQAQNLERRLKVIAS